jgi:hypothetical protein
MNKVTKLKTTTTLDDLATNPSLAKSLSPEEATDILTQIMAVQPVLMAQAFSDKGNEQRDAGDRLLKVEEVACRLNSPPDWVYRNTDKLPFTRRLSASQLRFSEKGLEKYIKNLPR